MYYDTTMHASGTTEDVDDGMDWDEEHTCVWMPVDASDTLQIDYTTMKISWHLNQQYYIESLQYTFGPDATIMIVDYVVPDIAYKGRFVNLDPANPENRLIDQVNIVIKSSKEKPSDFCNIDTTVTLETDETET
jgi:hypothetical protein